jgi:D-alanyl-D-alanine dipeptidase
MSITKIFWLSLILFIGSFCNQPDAQQNPYGLKIIADFEQYKNSIIDNPSNKLVDLAQFIPGLELDIRYAGTNNFTGRQVYEQPRAFLRLPVARALQDVNSDLNQVGLGLKVFDAYRPYSATVKFYEIIGDTNFVAAPWHGSRHNRGCAVDVTLVDLASGEELEMPTAFDDFSEKAAVDFTDLPDYVIANRELLVESMKKHGFKTYPYEWWHFDFEGWEDFDLMDVSFEMLDNIENNLR